MKLPVVSSRVVRLGDRTVQLKIGEYIVCTLGQRTFETAEAFKQRVTDQQYAMDKAAQLAILHANSVQPKPDPVPNVVVNHEDLPTHVLSVKQHGTSVLLAYRPMGMTLSDAHDWREVMQCVFEATTAKGIDTYDVIRSITNTRTVEL